MTGPFDLTDRVAVVTGGGRGIGREIVRTLARAGAHVVVADIDGTTGDDAAAQVRTLGRQALAVRTDVADRASVVAMVDAAIARFARIDVLVNDAGICINEKAEDMTPDAWKRVVDIDLNGVFWCSQAVGRTMVARRAGAIVNIASMSGHIVNRPQPQAAYNAAKAAVIQLTRSLAAEWAGHGVRVNSVSPGYIGTEMTQRGMRNPEWSETWIEMSPMKRIGTPADVANAVWYLASDAAAFVTGADLVVDGGYTIW